MGHSVRQSVIQLVSQSVAGRGGEGWGSVTQLVGYSSSNVVSIGLPILLSVNTLFFVIVSTLEIFLANYNDYRPF